MSSSISSSSYFSFQSLIEPGLSISAKLTACKPQGSASISPPVPRCRHPLPSLVFNENIRVPNSRKLSLMPSQQERYPQSRLSPLAFCFK